jgi:UDP-glucose 4-epimerase
LTKKKILVTGGTGYIGSHTVVELLQKNFDVFIVDDLSNSYKWIVDKIEIISGKKPGFLQLNLCERAEVHKHFHSEKFDAVIHFAASKAVGESVEHPLKYYRNNIIGLINLLEVLQSKKNRIVFSSSCTVYGQPDKLPVSEDAPVKQPSSPYGNTKKICEDIIEDVTKVSDLSGISLRYFNPIGAHDSALIGELPLGQPNNLIPVITQTAIGRRSDFTVFGNNYLTPDGTCIRDYIHVVDIAKAHVTAVERLLSSENKNNFEIFNLGTGQGNSVMEIINTFEKVSGQKLNYRIGERREGDVTSVFADTTLANTELNWKAEKSLEEMLSSAWKWELQLSKSERIES